MASRRLAAVMSEKLRFTAPLTCSTPYFSLLRASRMTAPGSPLRRKNSSSLTRRATRYSAASCATERYPGMSMLGLGISGLFAASRRNRNHIRASCISDVRRRGRLRPDHFDNSLGEGVRDRDGQVVVRDLPFPADLAQDAAAAALAVRGAVEPLVEPGHVAGGIQNHVPVARHERPRLPLGEVGVRELAER